VGPYLVGPNYALAPDWPTLIWPIYFSNKSLQKYVAVGCIEFLELAIFLFLAKFLAQIRPALIWPAFKSLGHKGRLNKGRQGISKTLKRDKFDENFSPDKFWPIWSKRL